MLIRCKWCNPPRIIGEKEPFEDKGITDGICPECEKALMDGTWKKPMERKMTEDEKWQAMMSSCREAIKIINAKEFKKPNPKYLDFEEPEYCNWPVGSSYHRSLWGVVRLENANRRKKAPIL